MGKIWLQIENILQKPQQCLDDILDEENVAAWQTKIRNSFQQNAGNNP